MAQYIFIGGPLNHEIQPTDDSHNWSHHVITPPKAKWVSDEDDLPLEMSYQIHHYQKHQVVIGEQVRYFYSHDSIDGQTAVNEFFRLMAAMLDKYVEVNSTYAF
jgi:hypothetical protein